MRSCETEIASSSRRSKTNAIAAIVAGMLTIGVNATAAAGTERCAPFDHSHSAWNELLSTYVKSGWVNYKGLENTGRADLDKYIAELESICEPGLRAWNRDQKLAFWINAYNAFTIKLILQHYPLKSIRSIGFLPGAAFREEFIRIRIGGENEMSLNNIEHEILRKQFHEPRIHFALVCASKSCPMLRSEAYRANTLGQQLDDQARRFINDKTKNRFDADSRTLHLSAIFKWFKEDFSKNGGSVQSFVSNFLGHEAVRSGKVTVEYLDYDWSLNGT